MSWRVYSIRNTETNKRYIGLTKHNIKKRWKEHKSSAKTRGSSLFHNAILLYGVDCWEHEILEDNILTITEGLLREKANIIKYGSFENGYNQAITTGFKKGECCNKKKNKLVTIIHKEKGKMYGTVVELSRIIGVKRQNLSRVVRGERTHIHQWRVLHQL